MKFKVGDKVIVTKKFPVILHQLNEFTLNNGSSYSYPEITDMIYDSSSLDVGTIIEIHNEYYSVNFNQGEAYLNEEKIELASKLAKVLA